MADITSPRFSWSAAAIYNRTISATKFNEFGFNFNKWRFNEVTANTDVNFGIPRIEVEGLPFDRIRFGADRSEGTPGVYSESQMEFRDVFNWVVGNQSLKFGGEWRKEKNGNSLIGGARPLYSFVGLWNLANDAADLRIDKRRPDNRRPGDRPTRLLEQQLRFLCSGRLEIPP